MQAEQLREQLVNQIGSHVYDRVNRPAERAIAACVRKVFSGSFYEYLWRKLIEQNTVPIQFHIRQLIADQSKAEKEAE